MASPVQAYWNFALAADRDAQHVLPVEVGQWCLVYETGLLHQAIAAGAGPAKWSIAVNDTGPVDVRQFGAKFDGATNDTAAIQAALTYAIQLGRRVVLMPPGEAIIRPAAIDTGHALLIAGTDIELRGAGKRRTKLTFRLYDGSDPATHWPIVGGAVLRGHAIKIAGGSSHVRLCDFEVDGGAGYTGDYNFPADPVTGDGWDITHKAVYMEENTTIDDVEIEDCDIHSFRGELIFYGGSGLTNLSVTHNKLHDSNGSLVSFTAEDCLVADNEIYDTAANGIECSYLEGYSLYRHNNVHDIGLQGIDVYPTTSTLNGFVDIIENRVARCLGNEVTGIGVGATNQRVLHNLIVDCVRGFVVGPGGNSGEVDIDNVEVRGNRVIAHEHNVDTMGWINSGTEPRGLIVRDNFGMVSVAGRGAGRSFRRGININEIGGGTFGPGCVIERNHVIGTQSQDTDHNSVGRNVLLTTTIGTQIAAVNALYKPAFARISVSWQVLNTTDLSITVDWSDEDGNAQQATLLSGPQSAGFGSATWSGVFGGSSANVTVNATAGTANRAKISAIIEHSA